MTWLVQTLEKKAADGTPSGIWHLCCAREDGGFYAGCNHDHPTPQDAEECAEAKEKIGSMTGFPVREDRPNAKEALIKQMVDRFLMWKLPENFSPDGGVTFTKVVNPGTAYAHTNRPSGTNLLSATQAEEMIRYLMEGTE